MSAAVDAAREALQAAIVTDATARQVIEAIDAFEAAVRAECETAEGRLLDEALSTLRAEARADALDDETLGDALHSTYHPAHPLSGCYNPETVYGVWLPRFRAAIDALREGADKV